MSRCIGDADAKPSVIASPEVSQLALPLGSGGRLILASDGLWDAMNPKAASASCRGADTAAAATALLRGAQKAKDNRDDITVAVVDVLPEPGARLPLADAPQHRGGHRAVRGPESTGPQVTIKWAIAGVKRAPAANYRPPDEAARVVRLALGSPSVPPQVPQAEEAAAAAAAAQAAQVAAAADAAEAAAAAVRPLVVLSETHKPA